MSAVNLLSVLMNLHKLRWMWKWPGAIIALSAHRSPDCSRVVGGPLHSSDDYHTCIITHTLGWQGLNKPDVLHSPHKRIIAISTLTAAFFLPPKVDIYEKMYALTVCSF